MTIRQQLASVEAALEKATKGPWEVKGCCFDDGKGGVNGSCHWEQNSLDRAHANAKAVATLHNSVPALIASHRRLEQALKRLMEAHANCVPDVAAWDEGRVAIAALDAPVKES